MDTQYITLAFTNFCPNLHCLMDNLYLFQLRSQELQLAQIEKQQILEFESRLAAASSKQVGLLCTQVQEMLGTLVQQQIHKFESRLAAAASRQVGL